MPRYIASPPLDDHAAAITCERFVGILQGANLLTGTKSKTNSLKPLAPR